MQQRILDIEALKSHYPSSVWIPLEQVESSLIHAERLTRFHSKNGQLSTCRRKMSLLKERSPDLDIVGLAEIADRIKKLEYELAALQPAQAMRDAATNALAKKNLADQCATVGVILEEIATIKTENGWVHREIAYRKPERAAYAMYAGDGYCGAWIEGRAILMLMHAACTSYAIEHFPYHYGRREPQLIYQTGIEGIAFAMYWHVAALVETIRFADRNQVAHALSVILPFARTVYVDAETSYESLLALWDTIGAHRIADLAAVVMEDPFYYRSGWPDLTLVRGEEVRFVEVKTVDRLHHSQLSTFTELLLPLGADVRVLKLHSVTE